MMQTIVHFRVSGATFSTICESNEGTLYILGVEVSLQADHRQLWVQKISPTLEPQPPVGYVQQPVPPPLLTQLL